MTTMKAIAASILGVSVPLPHYAVSSDDRFRWPKKRAKYKRLKRARAARRRR